MIKHIHSSSRFDRSLESLRKSVQSHMKISDVITMTEVAFEKREKQLNAAGWDKVTGDRGNKNDSAILFKSPRFKVIYSEQVKLSDETYFKTGGRGKTEVVYATIAVLEDTEDGGRICIAVAHLPSHVEGDMRRNNKTRRVVAFLANVRGLRRAANRVARKGRADGTLIVADWNISIKQSWVRGWFKVNFPAYSVTWNAPFPTKGTHGKRIIDLSLTKGKLKCIVRPRLLPDDNSSDHRPYIETLALTK